MNQSLHSSALATVTEKDEDAIDISSYFDLLIDNRWLIALVAVIVTLLGSSYALLATPVFQANMLVQVEEGGRSTASMFGELAGAFDDSSAAASEMEILRSRYVVSRAVSNAGLDLIVQPKRFPLIGDWISRGKHVPSDSSLGGYAWGGETASVAVFDVPAAFHNLRFALTATGPGTYRLRNSEVGVDVVGKVGDVVTASTAVGPIRIQVADLKATKGTEFFIVRAPFLEAVEQLQAALTIAEKGKQSGIIGLSLDGTDPVRTARTLNEIGKAYILQNIERKSEEAQKSLAFLEKQLPEMKANLEEAEQKYNSLRNNRGTVDLTEEARTVLQQSVLSQTKRIELKQKRDELLTRYQETNPLVVAVGRQMQTLDAEIEAVNAKIKRMPAIEQDLLRLARDIKVNTDLYTSLLNSAQQLRLVKASKVGNARVLDESVSPRYPVRPNRTIVVIMAAFIGVMVGIAAAIVRRSLFGGIDDPHEVEQRLGLSVSAAIPHSAKQESLYIDVSSGTKKISVLAHEDPTDNAIESLRSFRTALQFAMLSAPNKIVMITGPTPGVGKSFVSVNFAAVLASTGKRVLLIDADIRKGYLNKYFGLQRELGLSEVIIGDVTLEKAVHRSVVDHVDFLSTGTLPPRPAELLEHGNLATLLQQMAREYDFVVIDTAPILAVTDAMIVAPHVGAIFSVVRGGVSTLGEIEESVKRLNKAGNKVSGIVFNDLKQRAGRYGYGSKYGKYRYAQYKY